jgi:ABC-2 type transport system ATP-binding protein
LKAIEVNELTKYWGKALAVDSVSFQVDEGEVFGFLGPNGAGKTSTIKVLVGLTNPSGGYVNVAGYDVVKEPTEVKKRIGVVPDSSNLYDELTVMENLEFVSKLYHIDRKQRDTKINELLGTFQLEQYRNRPFGKLSKGLKRRTVLAAALIHEPKILFMDEPTSGLDVMSARALRELIKELAKSGVTIFLTTHYIEEAGQLCDRIAILVKGRIVVIESPEALRSRVQDIPLLSVEIDSIKEFNIESLQGVPATSIRQLNGRILIQTLEVQETLKALIRLAEEQGIKVKEVQTIKPSLEDAFVQLTGITAESMTLEVPKNKSG